MIQIKDLKISYGDHVAFNCDDHSFEEGIIHGIVGLNGAGKTSFFNTMAGYLPVKQGQIRYNGLPLKRGQIGYLETHNYFYPNITGREYLDIFPNTNSRFQLEKLNQLFQLRLDEITEGYSTGMRKKLALLAILKQNRPVYIMDEPFNGLDLETNRALEITIAQLKANGSTILISSHILAPLLSICDKAHLLRDGQFVRTYDKNELHTMEAELFSSFNLKATEIIRQSV